MEELPNQMNFIKGDWKYFLVLDAVRYDYFEMYNPFKGEVKKVYGIASHTDRFYKDLPELKDVTLISSTPYAKREKFLKTLDVWNYGWSERLGVHPDILFKETVKEIERNPNARIMVHILQPHFPFIGYPSLAWGKTGSKEMKIFGPVTQLGQVGDKYYIACYVANLALGFQFVARILPYLDGKIIVTTDHGTAFGEMIEGKRQVGHNPVWKIPLIRHIPLLIINRKDRIDLSVINENIKTYHEWGIPFYVPFDEVLMREMKKDERN